MRNPLIPRMQLDAVEYPPIPAVPEGAARPFWSVMIPTYNRPEYLRQTLESILKQDPGPDEMQIMVVDNASDVADIGALVQEIGGGRIEYHRHAQNIGLNANWTSCYALSRGQYVHLMHDDDLVADGFYVANRQHIETHGCELMFTQSAMINDQHEWLDLTRRIPVQDGIVTDPAQIIFFPRSFTMNSLIVKRSLLEASGGFHPVLHFGCDHELCARLFRHARVGFVARPLMLTREHGERDSSLAWLKADIVPRYLLGYQAAMRHDDSQRNRAAAYGMLSSVVRAMAEVLVNRGHFRAAFRLAIWAFRLAPGEERLVYPLSVVRLWLYRSKLRPLMRPFARLLRLGKKPS